MSTFLAPSPALETAIRTIGESIFTVMDTRPSPASFPKRAPTPA